MNRSQKNCPYVAVVGAVNIDIGGKSFKPLIERDSNPGQVSHSHGGVGRNIAHNLCLLGVDVKFITAMGDDMYADRISEHCKEIGMDLTYSIRVKGESTSTYLFITGPDGDMALAISDTSISKHITPKFIEERLSVFNNAAAVVFDTNLTEEAIEYLAKNCKAPLFVDPVSVSKAKKIIPVLGYLHTIKPNLIEAELISEVKAEGDEGVVLCGKSLYEKGVKNVFITMGEKGVFYYGEKGSHKEPPMSADILNTTGAGDAFCAAVIYSYLKGFDMKRTARFGQAAAALAIESAETINENLSSYTIAKKIELEERL